MSNISRFTRKAVRLAKNAVGGRGEVAPLKGGGGFADSSGDVAALYAGLTRKSYREVLDLRVRCRIFGEIALEAADLSDYSP